MVNTRRSNAEYLPVTASREIVSSPATERTHTSHLEDYSDCSILLLSGSQRPLDQQMPLLISQAYSGAQIYLVDQFEGTWETYLQREETVTSPRPQCFSLAEELQATRELEDSRVVIDCLSAVNTKFTVVMFGNGYHPFERVHSVVHELRTRYEFVICCPFSTAYGGKSPEQNCGRINLYLTRRRLSKRCGTLNDPFSSFFGAETCVLQNALMSLGGRGSGVSSDRLLVAILEAAKPTLATVQIHYQPYFSPGYKSARNRLGLS